MKQTVGQMDKLCNRISGGSSLYGAVIFIETFGTMPIELYVHLYTIITIINTKIIYNHKYKNKGKPPKYSI